MLGPTCPVERFPPDPNCAEKPYQTSLVITNVDATQTIKEFKTDATGHFKVEIKPGEYSIRSAQSNFVYPRCYSNGTVIVKTGEFTNIVVGCDTGIR